MKYFRQASVYLFFPILVANASGQNRKFELRTDQLTSGSKHHFFGYIGQCRTIPWNGNGRYILGLEIDTIHRMPEPGEAAGVILVDTWDGNRILHTETTCAWNPQQGTMFYWNPESPENQFFFNDVDVGTGEVYTVMYDIEKARRVREYRFEDAFIGNGGVAPDGSYWLGLNYGRLARLRPVTGYPGARDWSEDETAPENDGIFRVNVTTGEKQLLASYHQLNEKLKEENPGLIHDGLFINHTLWNREGDRIYFFVRAGWNGQGYQRIDVPFSIHADGTHLTLHGTHIGGHPEWYKDGLLIGKKGNEQVLYDVDKGKIVGHLGNPDIFPDPGADIALSPDGKWFVNGYKKGSRNYYTVFHISDGSFAQSDGISRGNFEGNIRIDPAPRWNRTSDAILVPGIDENGTRQMLLIRVTPDPGPGS